MKLTRSQLSNGKEYVTITPPTGIGNTKCLNAIVIVIDVSGSMHSPAATTQETGERINHGWSVLDIAKHSSNTFITSLGPEDYVSIVTYSDSANVLVDWTLCSDANKIQIIQKIHSMRPERSTNFLAGLVEGTNQIAKIPVDVENICKYNICMIVTTDGMPSSQWHPARGREGYKPVIMSELKKIETGRSPDAVPSIYTIGIGVGNQLDTELLSEICCNGGSFLHMPDPGQIGPFTVNLSANVQSVACYSNVAVKNCSLRIGESMIPIGSLNYDQERVFEIPMDSQKESVTLCIGNIRCNDISCETVSTISIDEIIRFRAIETLRLIFEAMKSNVHTDAQAHLTDFFTSTLREYGTPTETHFHFKGLKLVLSPLQLVSGDSSCLASGILKTFATEVNLACNYENMHKWGKPYVCTLMHQLRLQRRSNFRDDCLQLFGKTKNKSDGIFEEYSNTAEMHFATLKPPEPSLLNYTFNNSYNNTTPPPRPHALPDEFMRGGGCFGPDAIFSLSNGEKKYAHQILFGDEIEVVVNGQRVFDAIKCVVKTHITGKLLTISHLKNLQITPWHPIKLHENDKWNFPENLWKEFSSDFTGHVYNFVMSQTQGQVHSIIVNEIECAALGHNLEEPVVQHDYWGTERVIQKLKSHPTFESGYIEQ